LAVKKSELYSSLWKSCDELRGGMDASQYKDYVLVLLFVKYVSDRYAGNPGALIDVPEGGSFADMVKLIGKPNIGEGMNIVLAKLAEANELQGVIDVANFADESKLGSGKAMVDRLSALVGIFNSGVLDFTGNTADDDDLLGDAYEYLMRHFATESGKSKGQFYTPAEVSRIMAQLVGLSSASSAQQTIYDPTCGSGSLLLKAHSVALRKGHDLAVYGQEMDVATAGLARMNMILHECPGAEIERENTLSAPAYLNADGSLKTFDFVVANPPFSNKNWTNGLDPKNDEYDRFGLGVPPKKNGDYAFVLHMLASLKTTGKAAVILPHGTLFRGGSEAVIRRGIIEKGYIKTIVGLPANLFYGTGIPAIILILDKEDAPARKHIFMVDASKGFKKDGNKNRLRERDIHRIIDVVAQGADVPGYARSVPISEVADPRNDYNLNLSRYIENVDTEPVQDLRAHLRGGLPNADIDALAAYWDVSPDLRDALFEPSKFDGYSQMRVALSEIESTIEADKKFTAWAKDAEAAFGGWLHGFTEAISAIDSSTKPKDFIETLSESLLAAMRPVPLLDAYGMYQRLMDYWDETLQDDVYLVSQLGWLEAAKPRSVPGAKDGVDFAVNKTKYQSDLLPARVLVSEYFPQLDSQLTQAKAVATAAEADLEALHAEGSGEEGFLSELLGDSGKVMKKALSARIGAAEEDPELEDELTVLTSYLSLLDEVTTAKSAEKALEAQLNAALARQYFALDEVAAKSLCRGKWLQKMGTDSTSARGNVSHTLASEVRAIHLRYERPSPELAQAVGTVAARVEGHLARMGLSWR